MKAPWIVLGFAAGVVVVALAVAAIGAGAYIYFCHATPMTPSVFFAIGSAGCGIGHIREGEFADDMRDVATRAAEDFQAGRFDESASEYQKIIDKYPDNLFAWSNLGVTRFQQGKYPEATEALQRSVRLAPGDAFSWSNLGITYYQLQRYDEGVVALEKSVALDPQDAKAHNYLGCCYSRKGRQMDAKKEFLKALEINTKFGDAYFNLALVCAKWKPPDLDAARKYYQQARDLGVEKDPRMEKLLNGT